MNKQELFINKELKQMIIPLFLEQLLVMFVGLADTLVISYAGEAAVSGVSLVNQFNTIFIYLFTALASGGAVVISQYIGRQETGSAGESASQLLLFSTLFSVLIGAVVLIGNESMLRLLFGKVETPVMEACITYLRISAYSYPALAIYNAGAAVYRSLGKTNVTMYISVASNVINVVGNVIGVFVLRAGVAGVAWPSFIARVFSAVVITALCFCEKNGVAQSIWSLAALAGVAMGPVFITVIGQCMGNGNIEAAEYYFGKLTKLTLLVSAAWNFLIFILTPVFLLFYSLSPETKQLVIWLVLIHNVFNAVAYPFSRALSNGLRAAGDVKFTMYVSVIATVAVRLFLSYLLGITLQMGVIGIALAMVCDWIVRAVLFIWRERSGKWKTFQII